MPQAPDPFGIRAGSHFVMSRARSVAIDHHRVADVARRIIDYPAIPSVETWERDHLDNLKLSADELANYVLVLDALNFCFWGEPRWRVVSSDGPVNGYWALTAALRRALEEGYPITDARYLSTIPTSDVAHILRGESVIPSFAGRVHNLREAGLSLLRECDGQFLFCIQRAEQSGPVLLRDIIALFPSFIDVQTYDSRAIPFYKRAQILVSDLASAFESRGATLFSDLSFLTAFADYKVPQVLHQLGVLGYSTELTGRLRHFERIPAGSREEVEIRAATIVAVGAIAQATAESGVSLPDYAIDWRLWALGQREDADQLPYHRTPTTAY